MKMRQKEYMAGKDKGYAVEIIYQEAHEQKLYVIAMIKDGV